MIRFCSNNCAGALIRQMVNLSGNAGGIECFTFSSASCASHSMAFSGRDPIFNHPFNSGFARQRERKQYRHLYFYTDFSARLAISIQQPAHRTNLAILATNRPRKLPPGELVAMICCFGHKTLPYSQSSQDRLFPEVIFHPFRWFSLLFISGLFSSCLFSSPLAAWQPTRMNRNNTLRIINFSHLRNLHMYYQILSEKLTPSAGKKVILQS